MLRVPQDEIWFARGMFHARERLREMSDAREIATRREKVLRQVSVAMCFAMATVCQGFRFGFHGDVSCAGALAGNVSRAGDSHVHR